VRLFFDEPHYVEVRRACCCRAERRRAARPFVTRHNALGVEFSCASTELDLKRLVWAAWTGCTKSAASSATRAWTLSNPEFTSIEFYQAYATTKI